MSSVRYKFQGSKFRVQTGFQSDSPPQAITGITLADPAVVTSTAHGYVDGDVVKITGVVGMTEVNEGVYVVDNADANTFELAGIDSTGYTPRTSGGVLSQVVLSNWCEVTGFDQQDGTADTIEATTICSTAKEFEQGLSDSGTMSLNFNFAPKTLVQTAMREAKKSGDQTTFELELPKNGGILTMLGTVQSTSFSGSNNGIVSGSASIKLTGEIFVH